MNPLKILVVHRRQEIVDQIKLMLYESGPLIRFHDSGLDGLLSARVVYFNLIFCSIDLPVITGFELVRTLRNESLNKRTPVFFFAESASPPMANLMRSLGVEGWLSEQEIPVKLKPLVYPVLSRLSNPTPKGAEIFIF